MASRNDRLRLPIPVALAAWVLTGLIAPLTEAQEQITPRRQQIRSIEARRLPTLRVGLSSAPPEDGCEPEMQPAARPKMVFLNYFWYRPFEFDCTMMQPKSGTINSRDTGVKGYYHKRFKRLKRNGVDVLGFVFTGFEKPDDDVAGEPPHTVKHGRNLKGAISRAEDVGLPFFIYYDLAIRTAAKSHLCKTPAPANQYSCRDPDHSPISSYDLTDPVVFPQLRKDFIRIKDDFILPHLDSYYMLEDEDGNLILDENGLPRPVIGIYIAREFKANAGIRHFVNRLKVRFKRDGLGTPAFVLDTIFWNDPVREPVLKRFDDSVVAVTSFFPVNQVTADDLGIFNMAQWVPALRALYRDAALGLQESDRLSHLQVWPGIATQFDNRRRPLSYCAPPSIVGTPESFWHIRDSEDWRDMLRMGYESTYRVASSCRGAPSDRPIPQTLVINYENEFRESAVTDCTSKTASGQIKFPYKFGCTLLKVVKSEDRYK